MIQLNVVPGTAFGFVIAMLVFVPEQIDPDEAETSGIDFRSINTSSYESAQTPLLIVQRKTYKLPAAPVKVVPETVGSAKLPPVPLTTVHIPVPTMGAFPARIVLVPPQRF
jgi:hypothetical protein